MVSSDQIHEETSHPDNLEATSGGNSSHPGETGLPWPTRDNEETSSHPGNPNSPSKPEGQHQQQRQHVEYQASTIWPTLLSLYKKQN